jgi:Zinc metalloprotease (elastase)
MHCSIIPDDVLKKIKDKNSQEITQKLREQRIKLLQLRLEGKIPEPAPTDEIRVLFDGHHNDKLDDADSNILEIDYERGHVDVKTNIELEMMDKVWDFFSQYLHRESFDGKGAAWKIFKYVGEKYNNAFWNGEVFAFGDGDQIIFRTFWIQDVCTHEAMHGVTEHVAGLVYQGESGALNEHISDVFGICCNHKLHPEVPESDKWIIGLGIWTPQINGKGLRSFTVEPAYDDPILGIDAQPKHMINFYKGIADHGGVHLNSGIPNHAFYAFCKRSGKKSYEEPLKIWWDALQHTGSFDNFQVFANKTVTFAPINLKQHLIDAWGDVGIYTVQIKPSLWGRLIEFFRLIFRR